MFSVFERLVAPFPDDDRVPPRDGLLRFVVFYAKPVWPLLVAMAVLDAAIWIIVKFQTLLLSLITRSDIAAEIDER